MAGGEKRNRPTGYQKYLAGEFREAGWTVFGNADFLKAHCPCAMTHKTYLRPDVSEAYAREKLAWLFNETCYGS